MSAVLLKDFHLEQQEVGDILEKVESAEVNKKEFEGEQDERTRALWDLVRIKNFLGSNLFFCR